MKIFPKTVTLIDTGERRYPVIGELYYLYNPDNNKVTGPYTLDIEDEVFDWWAKPENIAIYKVDN